jgi:hypothetical protein
MAPLLPPVRRPKSWWQYLFLLLLRRPRWWWQYLLLLLLVIFLLLWKVAPGRVLGFLERLSPFHIGTPQISATVVDAVTGKPVPGMDVCLLVTYMGRNFASPHEVLKVMRSQVTRTDASGRFFFARWDDVLDLFEEPDGFGIAVTDPAARWKEVCGTQTYLLAAGASGHGDIFESESYFQRLPDSAAKNLPPYFPVGMFKYANDPHPLPSGGFPDGTLIRKLGNPSNLRIALVPLLRDANECRLAQNSNFAELCRQMNESLTADELRRSWKISPPAQ